MTSQTDPFKPRPADADPARRPEDPPAEPGTPDLDKAKTVPAAVFDHPQEVVAADVLTEDDKKEILEQWEEDAFALARADSEGMTGGEPARLATVQKARRVVSDDQPREKGNRPLP